MDENLGAARAASGSRAGPGGASPPTTASSGARPRPARGRARRLLGAVLVLVVAVVGAPLAYQEYQVSRSAGAVRRGFAAHRYREAREPLRRWLRQRPRSAEAHYYRAWLALVTNQPNEAAEAIDQATKLGADATLLSPLTGIYWARAGRLNQAEPLLRAAFQRNAEPQIEIAQELAGIYLKTYRLPQAGVAIERWRTLAPEDPQPYLWSNEVATRTDTDPSVLIRNYRAALELDPNLDRARLGLAQQLSKARRFDEAEQEYRAYLQRNPQDVSALVGLGRNAFQQGDIHGATRSFEAALEINPRQPDALKELAQAELRLGRYDRACQRFERLIPIEPYDHEVRYAYAQALKLNGDAARARTETELAGRLRKEHDHMLQFRYHLKDPNDVASRYEVAKWLLEHGHAEEGLKWTREVLRADPRHAPTHRLLADYYQRHGDPGLANYHQLMASSIAPQR
ncbi:MAG TPA: tetratricopeptide repeat protein [Isosphaeraceae bacterium]|nr:tetratricopeptide repeat protein [Isosphaeraceae bacterium]